MSLEFVVLFKIECVPDGCSKSKKIYRASSNQSNLSTFVTAIAQQNVGYRPYA